MDTPSHILAKTITDILVKEKLISADTAKKFEGRLADGSIRPEEWRLALEIGKGREPRQ